MEWMDRHRNGIDTNVYNSSSSFRTSTDYLFVPVDNTPMHVRLRHQGQNMLPRRVQSHVPDKVQHISMPLVHPSYVPPVLFLRDHYLVHALLRENCTIIGRWNFTFRCVGVDYKNIYWSTKDERTVHEEPIYYDEHDADQGNSRIRIVCHAFAWADRIGVRTNWYFVYWYHCQGR